MFIVALVAFKGMRHAFVPTRAHGAAPMATAGGMLSMLGAQAAHAVTVRMRQLLVVAVVVLTGVSQAFYARCSQCGSHGPRRRHALRAGRASGSCCQDRCRGVHRSSGGRHGPAARGRFCERSRCSAHGHRRGACSPRWARRRLMPTCRHSEDAANSHRGRGTLHGPAPRVRACACSWCGSHGRRWRQA